MAERTRIKRQPMIYKALHRQIKHNIENTPTYLRFDSCRHSGSTNCHTWLFDLLSL